MPTFEELVYSIHIFLMEIQEHTYSSTIATGGPFKIPSIYFEFADPRRFTEEIREHLEWERRESFKTDYGQNAFEAFMTMRELCARAMQYGEAGAK